MSGQRRSQSAAPPDELQALILTLTGDDAPASTVAGKELWLRGGVAIPALMRAAAEWLCVPGFQQPHTLPGERRATAIFAVLSTLAAIDAPSGLQAMQMVLTDESAEVRRAAVTLLEELGPAGFLALEATLDEGSDAARVEAAWALGQLALPEGIAALSQALATRLPELQVACAHALYQIALLHPVPELRLAVRRLEELARFGATDPLPVRDTCQQTLRQINAVTQPNPTLPIPAGAAGHEVVDLPIPHQAAAGEDDPDA